VIPEILIGKSLKQNHHIYDVFEHSVRSLGFCPSKKLEVRLASLLHDIGKPGVMKESEDGTTFYNHEFLGAETTKSILLFPERRLLEQQHLLFSQIVLPRQEIG